MMPPRARVAPDDHAYWQLRALHALFQITARHQTLPTLRWTVAPHGCGLSGEVVAPDAYTIERTFAEWQTALRLPPRDTDPRQLVAAGQIHGCRITISAVLPAERT